MLFAVQIEFCTGIFSLYQNRFINLICIQLLSFKFWLLAVELLEKAKNISYSVPMFSISSNHKHIFSVICMLPTISKPLYIYIKSHKWKLSSGNLICAICISHNDLRHFFEDGGAKLKILFEMRPPLKVGFTFSKYKCQVNCS